MTRKTPDHPAPVAATTAARMETGSSTPENPTPALPADARSAGEPHGTTAGPWYVENTWTCGARVVHGEPNEDGFRDDVPLRHHASNCNLAAAAPEMYAALWSAEGVLSMLSAYRDLPENGRIEAAIESLRRAIAKARGEQGNEVTP